MAVEIQEQDGGKLLEVRASGKLTKQDYDRFVPLTDVSSLNTGRFVFCSKCVAFTAGKPVPCGRTSSST